MVCTCGSQAANLDGTDEQCVVSAQQDEPWGRRLDGREGWISQAELAAELDKADKS
jgi:hypothetical protein